MRDNALISRGGPVACGYVVPKSSRNAGGGGVLVVGGIKADACIERAVFAGARRSSKRSHSPGAHPLAGTVAPGTGECDAPEDLTIGDHGSDCA